MIDSRGTADAKAVRRRRHCEGCGERFTTYETAAEDGKSMAGMRSEIERLKARLERIGKIVGGVIEVDAAGGSAAAAD